MCVCVYVRVCVYVCLCVCVHVCVCLGMCRNYFLKVSHAAMNQFCTARTGACKSNQKQPAKTERYSERETETDRGRQT